VETKDGPVIWEDHFYPEIVDTESGTVLPEGTIGELVLTTLTKEALPVIRYRTRDLTALLPPTARAMRRMARIRGRSDDMLIIRGVNVFPSQIEELVLKCEGLSPHYQLEVSRSGQLDQLTVSVERSGAPAAGNEPHEALRRTLEDLIRGAVGLAAQVRVLEAGTLERTPGKARRVIDTRPLAGNP
jgi:phenylacetate-CoA ligase